MAENEGQAKAAEPQTGEEGQVELGPIEKLEEQERPATGSLVPGTQKPESEVQGELKPNTE